MSGRVRCVILRETERALLVRQEQRNRAPVEAWVPISQCDHISKGPLRDDGSREATLTVADWIIMDKGLVES